MAMLVYQRVCKYIYHKPWSPPDDLHQLGYQQVVHKPRACWSSNGNLAHLGVGKVVVIIIRTKVAIDGHKYP